MNFEKIISVTALLISLGTIFYHAGVVKRNIDHLSKNNNDLLIKVADLEGQIKKIQISEAKIIENQKNTSNDVFYLKEDLYKIEDIIDKSSKDIRDKLIEIYKDK